MTVDTFFLLSISFFHLIVPFLFLELSLVAPTIHLCPIRLISLFLLVVFWLMIRTAHPILTSILIVFPRSHLRLIHYNRASSCLRWLYYRIPTWDLWESYSCVFHFHQRLQLLIYWICTQFKRLYSILVPLPLTRLTARVLSPNFQNSYFRLCGVWFESVMSLINEVLRRLYTSSRKHSSFTPAPTALTLTLTATCLSLTWIWVSFLVFTVFFSPIIYCISFVVLTDARFFMDSSNSCILISWATDSISIVRVTDKDSFHYDDFHWKSDAKIVMTVSGIQ